MIDYLGVYRAHAATLPGIDLMLQSARADGRRDLIDWCLDVWEAESLATVKALEALLATGQIPDVPEQGRRHD